MRHMHYTVANGGVIAQEHEIPVEESPDSSASVAEAISQWQARQHKIVNEHAAFLRRAYLVPVASEEGVPAADG